METIVYLIVVFLVLPILLCLSVFFILKKIFGVKKLRTNLIVSSVILIIIGVYTYEKLRFISSYKSPNKKYELIVKREELISDFIPTMPGQGGLGDKSVIVILKCNGKEINRSKETILYQSLEIEWYLDENKVNYTRPKYFKLLEK